MKTIDIPITKPTSNSFMPSHASGTISISPACDITGTIGSIISESISEKSILVCVGIVDPPNIGATKSIAPTRISIII